MLRKSYEKDTRTETKGIILKFKGRHLHVLGHMFC